MAVLRVLIYVDENNDNLPSPGEGVHELPVHILRADFSSLGVLWTEYGVAEIFVPAGRYYVMVPYLGLTAMVTVQQQSGQQSGKDVVFRLPPPQVPILVP